MHVQQARTLTIPKGTFTTSHTPVARRKPVATLLLLGVQVVVVCPVLGDASSSIEQASRVSQGMTMSDLEARRVVVVAWACRNICWQSGDTRLRGRPGCWMARLPVTWAHRDNVVSESGLAVQLGRKLGWKP